MRAKTTHVNKEMIYLELAEALNPVSTLSLSLCFLFFAKESRLEGLLLDMY